MSKPILIAFAISLFVLLLGALSYVAYHHFFPLSPVDKNEEEVSQPFPQMTVKTYLVAIGDKGQQGKLIGCEDSLVFVENKINPTKDQIGGAITKLLSLSKEDYNSAQLYNSLYQSNLQLDKVVQTNRHADVYLQGSVMLGGVCDEPRVIEQLTATAMQFPIVDSVTIYINDKPIDEVVTSKGN